MLTLRRALKRKKLFEKLDKKWKTAELVLLGQETYIIGVPLSLIIILWLNVLRLTMMGKFFT